MLVGELGLEHLDRFTLLAQRVALQGYEDFQDPCGGRGRAGPGLRVESDLGGARVPHPSAHLTLNQRANEQCQELAAEQCFDAGRVAQQDRGCVLHGSGQVVLAFQVRLVLVRGQDLGPGEGAVVGDQREAAITGGIVGDVLEVDLGTHGEAADGGLLVAGARAGSAGAVLLVALLHCFGEGEVDPGGGAGFGQGGGGGLFGRDPGLDLRPGSGQLGFQCFDARDSCLDTGLAVVPVAGGLRGGMHPCDPVSLDRGRGRLNHAVDLFGSPARLPGLLEARTQSGTWVCRCWRQDLSSERVRGKSLTPEQAERYRPWFENARRLREALTALEASSLQAFTDAEK